MVGVRQWLVWVAFLLFLREAVHSTKPSQSRRLPGAAVCQSKYCQQIHVDAPENTLMKDQSLQMGLGNPTQKATLPAILDKVTSDYVVDGIQSPGVKLVARGVLAGEE